MKALVYLVVTALFKTVRRLIISDRLCGFTIQDLMGNVLFRKVFIKHLAERIGK